VERRRAAGGTSRERVLEQIAEAERAFA